MPPFARYRLKLGSQYDASQCVIHLKPVQNRSQLTHDDAHPFAPKRWNRNLFYSCVRVVTHHIIVNLALVSRRRPLPREKGSGDISIANLFCWNADMSWRAQKPRSSQGNCKDVWQLLCCIFFMAAVLCIACGLILAQNPELILVLVS